MHAVTAQIHSHNTVGEQESQGCWGQHTYIPRLPAGSDFLSAIQKTQEVSSTPIITLAANIKLDPTLVSMG